MSKIVSLPDSGTLMRNALPSVWPCLSDVL